LLRKLRNASRLSPTDWQFLLQAWVWLLFFDLGLRMRPFLELQAFASRPASHPAPPPEQTENLIRSLRTAVDHARFNHLYPMTCLRRALTLQKMLAHRGLATELKIGVRKEYRQFSAHAWLEYQGKPLGEPERITEQYAALEKASTSNE
jgi:hypothetical protein